MNQLEGTYFKRSIWWNKSVNMHKLSRKETNVWAIKYDESLLSLYLYTWLHSLLQSCAHRSQYDRKANDRKAVVGSPQVVMNPV